MECRIAQRGLPENDKCRAQSAQCAACWHKGMADSALRSTQLQPISSVINIQHFQKIKHQNHQKIRKLTLPVAPQHASLASSIKTDLPLATRSLAANAPVIPLPMTMTSAVGGRSGVERRPRRTYEGFCSQYGIVLCGVGSPDWPSRSVAVTMMCLVLLVVCTCLNAIR